MYSLAFLMFYYIALSKGLNPNPLGSAKEENKIYLQYLDPCEITGVAKVIQVF